MKELNFTKMVASGNDFVVVGSSARCPVSNLKSLAKNICDRKFGAGADGLLLLEKTPRADVRMRIFNSDGSEANMCGNGARCAALYASRLLQGASRLLKIETKAGIIEAKVSTSVVKIRLTEPKDIRLGIPVKIGNRTLRVNFINTGVPHAVVFVEGLDKIDVRGLGRQIRYHERFKPAGTNVDFVEVLNNDSVGIRTYERGVEDETLACGTGSVAGAIITAGVLKQLSSGERRINVLTRGKEMLKVYFTSIDKQISEVWLEGGAKIVYTGVYNV